MRWPGCTPRTARPTWRCSAGRCTGRANPPRTSPTTWPTLREWVEELVERFAHLDHTVIPVCWWRHNSHIEALQALKDHERVSYADSANGTAAVEWHRAFLVIETRLREWTGWSGCASGHKDPIRQRRDIDEAEWEEHVAEVERPPGSAGAQGSSPVAAPPASVTVTPPPSL